MNEKTIKRDAEAKGGEERTEEAKIGAATTSRKGAESCQRPAGIEREMSIFKTQEERLNRLKRRIFSAVNQVILHRDRCAYDKLIKYIENT